MKKGKNKPIAFLTLNYNRKLFFCQDFKVPFPLAYNLYIDENISWL